MVRMRGESTIMHNETHEKWMKIKKKVKKICIFVLVCWMIVFMAKRFCPLGRTDFKSMDHFNKLGGEGWRYGLPDGAADVHYYLMDNVLYKHSIYSFTIAEEKKYDSFMEVMRGQSCTSSYAVENPGWEIRCYVDWEYSEEELAAMKYLQENHAEMDYKEALKRSSAHKRGFANGYGAAVEDYLDEKEVGLMKFPINLPFDEVISDDIREYTILYYSPTGSGTQGECVLVNQETKRFVIYHTGALR